MNIFIELLFFLSLAFASKVVGGMTTAKLFKGWGVIHRINHFPVDKY